MVKQHLLYIYELEKVIENTTKSFLSILSEKQY